MLIPYYGLKAKVNGERDCESKDRQEEGGKMIKRRMDEREREKRKRRGEAGREEKREREVSTVTLLSIAICPFLLFSPG